MYVSLWPHSQNIPASHSPDLQAALLPCIQRRQGPDTAGDYGAFAVSPSAEGGYLHDTRLHGRRPHGLRIETPDNGTPYVSAFSRPKPPSPRP